MSEHGEGPKAAPSSLGPAGRLAREWQALKPYLALLDFGRRPETKAAVVVRFLATIIALVILGRKVTFATAPLLTARPAAAIPVDAIEDDRFLIPEHTRREIFAELATAELSERARAIKANSWNGHVWSREDDRGHYERVAARAVAAKYRISLSQTYLVLDEGLRDHWPAPDGKPLPATTPPLSIRSNSW